MSTSASYHFKAEGSYGLSFHLSFHLERPAMLALLIPSVSFHFRLWNEMKDEGEISTISRNGWFAITIRLGIGGGRSVASLGVA